LLLAAFCRWGDGIGKSYLSSVETLGYDLQFPLGNRFRLQRFISSYRIKMAGSFEEQAVAP